VFPWAEAELAKVVARNNDDSLPDTEKDIGAKNFLECLVALKTVCVPIACIVRIACMGCMRHSARHVDRRTCRADEAQ
jgi:hypothetical protein